jgi:hypothetical protein
MGVIRLVTRSGSVQETQHVDVPAALPGGGHTIIAPSADRRRDPAIFYLCVTPLTQKSNGQIYVEQRKYRQFAAPRARRPRDVSARGGGTMSDPSAAASRVITESDQEFQSKMVTLPKGRAHSRATTSRRSVQDILTSYFRRSIDFTISSDEVTTALEVWKRILAGGLGALSLQSAIALAYIPYKDGLVINQITLSKAVIPALVVLYWILISCLLFSGYNRKADFIHVFRASLLFNLFVVAVGHLGSLVKFGL